MKKSDMQILQNDRPDRGELKINVESALRTVPVENATVDISYTGEPDQILEEVRTTTAGSHCHTAAYAVWKLSAENSRS